ncbi:GNAT family N-acetyltransferase [Glycomyces terrestris]|uniref:GNAT family N-acetyltransferase n=1 Tax=Glycomyces terrestris TaxID=2493553 RepID=A0A426UW76_9ACTN|nr:GNAT family N-acetyltransferase [Glycomyces terrestris]RRR98574.1 GNAT family N-acetyltransferase [Glycomyces terrestris]
MPELIDPTPRLAASFTEALHEFTAADPEVAHSWTGMVIDRFQRPGTDWVAEYIAAELGWRTAAPDGFVPVTTLWWAEGDTYLGRISIRHRLNEHLARIGGHIGYDVRPSARRRGHSTAMLAAALPHAAALGIDRALVTCDASNTASRKVIERNGGVLEDQRGTTLRYLVPTA